METRNQRSRNATEEYELSDGESVSTGVVTAVAAASNAHAVPTADADPGTPVLDPLYGAVDPEALDALVGSDGFGTAGTPDRITFTYSGYEVTVTGDRLIRLERLERPVDETAK